MMLTFFLLIAKLMAAYKCTTIPICNIIAIAIRMGTNVTIILYIHSNHCVHAGKLANEILQ